MRTLLLIVGSIVSNRVMSNLLNNTAQPMARNLVRQSARYFAITLSLSLIGSLTVAGGMIISFIEMAKQVTEVGGLFFNPMIGFAMGLVVFGGALIYLGAFSNLFSPWRTSVKQDLKLQHKDDNAVLHLVESIITALRTRPSQRPASSYRERSYDQSAIH
jgi:hypothetical protein